MHITGTPGDSGAGRAGLRMQPLNLSGKSQPRTAVREYCTRCLGLTRFDSVVVKNCEGNQSVFGPCPFYSHRLGKRTSVKVFRKFCLACSRGDRACVDECPSTACPCYPYRYGTNPARKGLGASRESLRKAREQGVKRQISIFSPQGIS